MTPLTHLFRFSLMILLATGGAAIGPAIGHEVRPAIADLRLSGQGADLRLEINVEALLAGINLDGLLHTDGSPKSTNYDNLRALTPTQLHAPVIDFFNQQIPGIYLQDGMTKRSFKLVEAKVAPIGDMEVPRDSILLLRISEPLNAATVILHWPKGFGALILRHIDVEPAYTDYLDGGENSSPIPLASALEQTALDVLISYISVGFEHILPKGLDHILFVLGLYFLSVRFGTLVWQISAFTLAHSVTLALGAMGLVTVPAAIVEPLIAASIVYVAVENIATPRLHPWRPLMVFGFGLLHGLGFASVLGDFGLPQGQFVAALIGFNIGVELGQLTVIVAMVLMLGIWAGNKPWFRGRVAMPASALIGMIGAYWCVERTLS